MAITIQASPKAYMPSDNSVRWTFSSTNTGQANFSFFVEVYVNAVLHSSHLIFPSNGTYGFFDAQEIASKSVTQPTVTSALAADAGNYSSMYIKVYERYGTPPANNASATSSTITIFKASLSPEDYNDWVDNYPSPYIFGSGRRFLNQFPRGERLYCGLGERQWLMAITNNEDIVVNVLLWDSAGSPVAGEGLNTGDLGKIQIFDISPSSLIVSTALTKENFEAASYWNVVVTNMGLDIMENITIYKDTTCDHYDTQRLHFLTSYGSIDSFSFTKANAESRDLTRMNIQRQLGEWDDSNNYNYNAASGQEHDYLVVSKGKMEMYSDWLKDTVQNYLARELYESPLVYREPPYAIDAASRPIFRTKILNTSYRLGKGMTDGLLQEKVEVSMGTIRKSPLV